MLQFIDYIKLAWNVKNQAQTIDLTDNIITFPPRESIEIIIDHGGLDCFLRSDQQNADEMLNRFLFMFSEVVSPGGEIFIFTSGEERLIIPIIKHFCQSGRWYLKATVLPEEFQDCNHPLFCIEITFPNVVSMVRIGLACVTFNEFSDRIGGNTLVSADEFLYQVNNSYA